MLYIILESHPAYYAYIIIYPKIFSSEAARIQLAMHRRTSYSYDDALHSILFFSVHLYSLSLSRPFVYKIEFATDFKMTYTLSYLYAYL